MPVWIVLSFADLLDSEVGGDVIGEGGVGGARSYDGGGGISMSTIVTSLLDRVEPDEDVDVLVS